MKKMRQWRAAMRRRGAAVLLHQIEAANRMSYRGVEGFMHSGVVRAPPASMALPRLRACPGCWRQGCALGALPHAPELSVLACAGQQRLNLRCSWVTLWPAPFCLALLAQSVSTLLCGRAGSGVLCRDALVCTLEAALQHAGCPHCAGRHPGWLPVVDRAAIPARPRLRACSRRGPGKLDQRVAMLPYGTTVGPADLVHVQALRCARTPLLIA